MKDALSPGWKGWKETRSRFCAWRWLPRKGVERLFLWAFLSMSLHLSVEANDQGDVLVPTNGVQVIALQGTNWWVAPNGAADWVLASTRMPQNVYPGDRIRTGRHTRLFLRTQHLGVIQVPPLSTLEISRPPGEGTSLGLRILNGMLYLFHRGTPTDVEVYSRSASAAVRGTEFVAEALEDGGLAIRMVDGRVDLRNERGSVVLQKGEDGVAATGVPPRQTPALFALNAIQWCLYYPAVLDTEELSLDAETAGLLQESLSAYRSGDLAGALAKYPSGRTAITTAERVYLAALWLSLGQAPQAEALMDGLDGARSVTTNANRLAGALRLMIAATQAQTRPASASSAPELASEWMAESYFLQGQDDLEAARHAAQKATRTSPRFGFAWARLAELEFGFARISEASDALKVALEISPLHAAAVTLQGFQLCARNRIPEALETFNQAIHLDPGLGNAWLGRGLCRIRQGQSQAGLQDLEVAAAVEPQRALLRSYLGKAFSAAGDGARADKELELAREMDPNDPTSWLYSALLDQQRGRINQGIRHLQRSKELNQSRGLYRSRHLLDQDQAVRGANLSALYRDAGLLDLSRREAVEAVNTDYANASAHLFLANSYNDLRDPGQVDLRYETPWFTEYLIANLLAPVGAGILSQTVSAQEYSRLFERDGVGVVSLTEYASNGDWLQAGAQYGLLGNLAYSLEGDYRVSNGQRANQTLEQRALSFKFKQQLGINDSVYVQAVLYDAQGGDLGRAYDPTDPALSRPGYRFREKQEPLLLAGFHHQWSPGQHTLVLAGRLADESVAADPAQPVLLVSKDLSGAVTGTVRTSVDQRYRSEQELYSLELQHIAQVDPWTFIVGGRSQRGEFDVSSRQSNLADQAPALPTPLDQHVEPGLQRLSAYGYAQWKVLDSLSLFGGLTFDHLRMPSNHRFAPLLDEEESREQWSPKAGVAWKVGPLSTFSASYTHSLTGVGLDQSYRLEPSQVAGFNQAWRGLIPESVAGAGAGARLEMVSLQWDQRLPSETYLALRGDIGRSTAQRRLGVFDLPFLAEPSSTTERLDFREETLTLHLNQLVGTGGVLGAQYRLSKAQLDENYLSIPGSALHFFSPYQLQPQTRLESVLHQMQLFSLWNHPSGVFGRLEALWSTQSNQGYSPDRPGDSFWHFNVFAGYRFPRRRAEIRLGIVNLADRDYRLNPLNLTPELPRHRTFVASVRLSF